MHCHSSFCVLLSKLNVNSFSIIGNPDIYYSNVIEVVSEWCTFVLYGSVIDVRPYAGDWHFHCSSDIIESAVRDYKSAPAGYAIDFGITRAGQTVLIEVNDGYSLGSYGLDPVYYAKLLSARWAQLTNTIDQCQLISASLRHKAVHQ